MDFKENFKWVLTDKNYELEYSLMVSYLSEKNNKNLDNWLKRTDVYKDDMFLNILDTNFGGWIRYIENVNSESFVEKVVNNKGVLDIIFKNNTSVVLKIYDKLTEDNKNYFKNYLNNQDYVIICKNFDFDFGRIKEFGIDCRKWLEDENFISKLIYVISGLSNFKLCLFLTDCFFDKDEDVIKNWFIKQFEKCESSRIEKFLKNVISNKYDDFINEDYDENKKTFIRNFINNNKEILLFLIDEKQILHIDALKSYVNDTDVLNLLITKGKSFIADAATCLDSTEKEEEVLKKALLNNCYLSAEQYKKICRKVDKKDLINWHKNEEHVDYKFFFPKKYIDKDFVLNLGDVNIGWFRNKKFIKIFNELNENELFLILKNNPLILEHVKQNLSEDVMIDLLKEYKKNNHLIFDYNKFSTNKRLILEVFKYSLDSVAFVNSLPSICWKDEDISKCIVAAIITERIDVKQINNRNMPLDVRSFFNNVRTKSQNNINIEFKKLLLENDLKNKETTKIQKI